MRILLALAVSALPYPVLAAGTTALGPCPPGFVEVRSPQSASGPVTLVEGNTGGTAACMPAPPLRTIETAIPPTPFPVRDFRDPMPANPSELRLVSYNPPSPTALAQETSTRVLTRTYDDFDRVASETVPLEDGGTATIRYTYWKNGVRKTMTDAFGRVTFYEYDGKNRLSRVTANQGLPDQLVTSYTYWPDDLLKTITAPNGTLTTYAYDLADRVTFIDVTRENISLLSYEYTYDPNGNRLSQIETNGGVPELTTYTYDARDRIETVTYPSGTSVAYGYDPVGNRTSEIERDPSGTVVSNKTAVFDAINRLSSVTDPIAPSNDATFTYDANGNLLSKTTAAGTESYDYDPRDLMVEARTGTAILARYAYDAFGRRYLKVSSEGAFVSVVRQYLYDQTSLLHELDESDLEVAKYEYTGDRLASLVRRDEPRRFYHQDALGSVVALSDSAGAVVARYHLDAWGRYRAPSELDASANRFGFTGYLFDQETELYYAKARFYDPEYGRFTSQDSVLGEVNEPPSLHRYFYGYANPLRYVDPTGHHNDELKILYQMEADAQAAKKEAAWCSTNASACAQKRLAQAEAQAKDEARTRGALRVVGGVVLIAGGVAGSPATAGVSLAGVGLGIDQTVTGIKEVWTGDDQRSFTGQVLETSFVKLGATEVEAQRRADVVEGLGLVALGGLAGTGGLTDDGARVLASEPFMSGQATLTSGASLASRELVVGSQAARGGLGAQSEGLWAEKPLRRGALTEENLAATEYKDWHHVGAERGGKFPLVDFQKGNDLVSLKTVDTAGKTWMREMRSHISDLSTRGATVNGQPSNMILDLRVPPGGTAAAHSLVKYGEARGVKVLINEIR